MIRFKKIMIILIICVLTTVCIVRIYHINNRYPDPENIAVRQGETTIYKGMKLTAKELEIYTEKELLDKYPKLADSWERNEDTKAAFTYIIANMNLKNESQQDISLGKSSITHFFLEINNVEGNAVSQGDFIILNPDYKNTFQAGSESDIKLVYEISDMYMTYNEIKGSRIKIVYSYYPTKNYLYYDMSKIAK